MRLGVRQDVVGERVRVGHDLDRGDGHAVERPARAQVAEGAAVGGGVARADLEHGAARERDAHDVVIVDRRAVDAEQRDGDDGAVVDAVDEIAGGELGDGAVARRRGDGRVGRRALALGAALGARPVHGRLAGGDRVGHGPGDDAAELGPRAARVAAAELAGQAVEVLAGRGPAGALVAVGGVAAARVAAVAAVEDVVGGVHAAPAAAEEPRHAPGRGAVAARAPAPRRAGRAARAPAPVEHDVASAGGGHEGPDQTQAESHRDARAKHGASFGRDRRSRHGPASIARLRPRAKGVTRSSRASGTGGACRARRRASPRPGSPCPPRPRGRRRPSPA